MLSPSDFVVDKRMSKINLIGKYLTNLIQSQTDLNTVEEQAIAVGN